MLTIKYLKLFVRQAEGLRGLSAEERYRFMLETQPEIVLRVSSKCMAAHLGINEFTLRKIRGRR
ncbi:MAG: hypothetical protein Q8937_07520 [Bacteroidota bacterium]|nr:hypothetical protein [Bacteroidota bacterium]